MSTLAQDARDDEMGFSLFDDYPPQEPAWAIFLSQHYADTPLPRWFRISDKGVYEWDEDKVTCLLRDYERSDHECVEDYIRGARHTSRLHPLIFDYATASDAESVWLRSIPFFQGLADDHNGPSIYNALDPQQKQTVTFGVRDLSLAAARQLLSGSELKLMDSLTRLLGDTGGRRYSHFPSSKHTVLNLMVPNSDGHDNILDDSLFAQTIESPATFAVFVDHAESSYHNFENIIPMDRWLASKVQDLSLSLSSLRQLHPEREVFTCRMQGDGWKIIKQISSLDLYVPPANAGVRGGQRFIFNSTILSKALTAAVRSDGVLDCLAGGKLANEFEFVNFVFRCNKFAPGDLKFHTHLDTPYYDSSRNQVSKYTMLIYLSTGRNESALRVQDVEMDTIEEFTCVVFDQRYAHEGRPFSASDKIFIRTELVFKDENLQHDIRIASLFSTACYMTSHAFSDASLSLYTHECFERANSFHWAVEREANAQTVYLQKQFRGIQFITNGYDYWFPKHGKNDLQLKFSALVSVLDHLNCKVDGKAFRPQCQSTTLRRHFSNTDEIMVCFQEIKDEPPMPFKFFMEEGVDVLFKSGPDAPMDRKRTPSTKWGSDMWECPPGEGCCYFHCWSSFNPWKHEDFPRVYKTCCDYTRAKLFCTPILVFDTEVMIVESGIKIMGDKIFILTDSDLPSINFAACQRRQGLALEFIGVDKLLPAPKLVIPPIVFHEDAKGFHLVLDMFRNDWVVNVDSDRQIPVPVITHDVNDDDHKFINRIPPEHRGNLEKLCR